VARDDVAPERPAGWSGDARHVPPGWSQQNVAGSGRAQQALQGAGSIQYNYFGISGTPPETALSIAPPLGQRDQRFPLRGRDSLVEELAGLLLAGQHRAGPPVRVLHGLGGCGKTSIALEVASQAVSRGIETWWVPAAEDGRFVAGMQAMARRVGITDDQLRRADVADLVWRHLNDRREPWLLVVDNADDLSVLSTGSTSLRHGTGWVRPIGSGAGLVLVTTRDGDPENWGSWGRLHRVGTLAPAVAIRVLGDHAGAAETTGRSADAEALARRLGGLPLALRLAGSYLAEAARVPVAFADHGAIRSYGSYQAVLDEGHLDRAFPGHSERELSGEQARELIGSTWELSLDLLERRGIHEARVLLRLLAVLADAPVPYELMLHWDTLASSQLLPGITGQRLWQVLRELAKFGLIDLSEPGSADGGLPTVGELRIHPLVRDASRPASSHGDDQGSVYLNLCAELLHRAATSDEVGPFDDPTMWPLWQMLAQHAFHVHEALAAVPGLSPTAQQLAADAADLAARYQAARGLYQQALTRQRSIFEACRQVLGSEHASTLTARHEIARMKAWLGNFAEADAEYRAVLEIETRVLGPEHPATLVTRFAVAFGMAGRGEHTEAEAELRSVLEAQNRVLGPEHRSTLITRQAIAHQMTERGDHAGAEAEHRLVLQARIRTLGAEHLATLGTRFDLARLMAERGHHAKAEAELRAVLDAENRVLGPEHPSSLATRQAIADQLAERGNHAHAEAEYRAVLEAKIRVLGAGHPSILVTRHAIASQHSKRGNHAQGEADYRAVLEAETRVLGPEHPTTLNTRYALAYQVAERGRYEQAETEYRVILDARTRVLGAEHPATLATRHEIARVMAERGDGVRAEAELRAVLDAKTRVLGTEHPETLATRQEIARVMAVRGDRIRAAAEYRAVLLARNRVLGADHPHTQVTARLLEELGERR
jgi:tetratricopeptide (TPR) repeat protein